MDSKKSRPLHQLYQGVFKHLKGWLIEAYGANEIDARVRRLPPNHNAHQFLKGISSLSRVTGQEHSQISGFLLGLIADLPLTSRGSSIRVVKATSAMLDFLYLAQYPVHSEMTLDLLDGALAQFHANKAVFIEIGIRSNFELPKLHALNHYAQSIRMLGTLDNFNTEYTERLHIDLAKDAYRATNKKDEYPQMTQWLERKEKIQRHGQYLRWRQARQRKTMEGGKKEPDPIAPMKPAPSSTSFFATRFQDGRQLLMAKHPSIHALPLERIQETHGAQFFEASLARFSAQLQNPTLSDQELENAALDVDLTSLSRVSTFHRVKFSRLDPLSGEPGVVDAIHVQPARLDKRQRTVPGRFDTALIRVVDNERNSLKAHRIGQIRLVFDLTDTIKKRVFRGIPRSEWPRQMAYVSWFTPFASASPIHGMYSVQRSVVDGGHLASIVDVSRIERSVQLIPKFGRKAPRHWTSSTVLDKCPDFYVNAHSDRHIYKLLRRWARK